jgi:hypothetical protein
MSFRGNGYACNNRGAVGNGSFHSDPCRGDIRRRSEAKIGSWEGVAFRVNLSAEAEESRYQRAAGEDTSGWKRLRVCSSEL